MISASSPGLCFLAEFGILIEFLLLHHALQQIEGTKNRDLAVDIAGIEIEVGQDVVAPEYVLLPGLEQDLSRRRVPRRKREENHDGQQHNGDRSERNELPPPQQKIDRLA